jgi:hypothetical protein
MCLPLLSGAETAAVVRARAEDVAVEDAALAADCREYHRPDYSSPRRSRLTARLCQAVPPLSACPSPCASASPASLPPLLYSTGRRRPRAAGAERRCRHSPSLLSPLPLPRCISSTGEEATSTPALCVSASSSSALLPLSLSLPFLSFRSLSLLLCFRLTVTESSSNVLAKKVLRGERERRKRGAPRWRGGALLAIAGTCG